MASPLLERFGLYLLRRLPRQERSREGWGDEHIHILNPGEQARLRAVERRAALRAAVVGAVAGFLGAAAEVLASAEVGYFDSPWVGWAVVGGVVLVVTAVELLYLFYFTLQSVEELAFIAGVELQEAESGEELRLVQSLARAALEVPNPHDPTLGVDPRREASRAWLLIATLIYKAKVGLTNLLLKTILQRVLGRVGLRYAAAYAAIPVVALWDAVVIVRVLREARIRVMGPSAVEVLLGLILPGPASQEVQQAMVGAVAAVIMRRGDMHPNLLALLKALRERFPDVEEIHLPARSAELIQALQPLDAAERRQVLMLLAVAAILPGRVTRPTRRFVAAVAAATGSRLEARQLEALRRRFVGGQPIEGAALDALFSRALEAPP